MPIEIRIDPTFDSQQMMAIQSVFNRWQTASDNVVTFKPIWSFPRPGFYKDVYRDNTGNIYMWYLDKDRKHFTTKQIMDFWENGGFVNYKEHNPTAHVVIFKDQPKSAFIRIVLHEIGHLIGLQHIENKTAVMHPNATSGCITQWDAHQLCSIYNCKPRPECF